MAFVAMGVLALLGLAGLFAYLRASDEQRDRAAATVALEVDDRGVERTMANGRVESVAWAELTEVEVITTSVGVHRDDGAVLVLGVDEARGCLVPSRLAADRGVIERLSRLPGFDARRLADALEQPAPSRTSCWVRPRPSS